MRMLEGIKLAVVRRLSGGEKGTSILEALLAAAILGTISVVFIGAIDGGMSRADQVEARLTADSLIRSQIEELKGVAYDSGNSYDVTVTAPNGFSLTIDVVDISPVAVPNSLQEIVLTVLRSGRPVMAVETLKVDR